MLPKSVKVGPHRHKVVVVKDLRTPEGHEAWGCYTAGSQTIQIDSEIAKNSRGLETLMHEVLHAIWDHQDLNKSVEEGMIRALSPMIMAFLIDNPEFVNLVRKVK